MQRLGSVVYCRSNPETEILSILSIDATTVDTRVSRKVFSKKSNLHLGAAVFPVVRPSFSQVNSMNLLKVDDVEVLLSAMLVVRGGAVVELTSVEFVLLAELARQAGEVADREALSRQVLGRAYSPSDRSLDNHVSHLCKKLGPAVDGRRRIVSVRGRGYIYRRFETAEVPQPARSRARGLQVAIDSARIAEIASAAQMSR